MKKRIMMGVSVLLVAIVMLSMVFSGCRDDNRRAEKIDSTKTQVYVANLFGGLGDEWLYQVKEEFEKIYADKSYEEGKIGVQVQINDYIPSAMSGPKVYAKMSSSQDDIYFAEGVDYYDFVNGNKLCEITDILSSPLTEYGESKSILEKLDGSVKDFLNANDKYYALPWYDGLFSLYYDVELFDKNNLYFKDGANTESVNLNDDNVELTEYFIQEASEKKSKGPDQTYGTSDDGLPITYKDFFVLCYYSYYTNGIVPMVWTGQYPAYMLKYAVSSLWATEEGYEGVINTLNFTGTATNLINSISATGEVSYMAPTAITTENGYVLQKQDSRYNVLQFLKELVDNSYCYDGLSFGGALSHKGAQDRFLYSRVLGNVDDIAMIGEGTYWYNEASSSLSSMASEYDDKWSKQNRKIAIMPPLKSKDDGNGTFTMISLNDSMCFINASSTGAKLEAAKDLFRFIHTDKALTIFTKCVGMTRPFNYVITGEKYNSLNYYAKSVYDLKQKSNIVYPLSKDSFFVKNMSFLSFENSVFTSSVNNNIETMPLVSFHSSSALTAKEYFNGLYNYTQKGWANLRK